MLGGSCRKVSVKETIWAVLLERGGVHALPNYSGTHGNDHFAGWACSNGKRYDDGMLVFNLAQPGETVTMTAIWE